MSKADYSAEIEHDGRTYKIEIKQLEAPWCTVCGTGTFTEVQLNAVTDALLKTMGFLHPSEIKAKRLQLGMTQKQLAEAIVVAEATLSRWESGAQIPQRHFDMMLRMYFDLPAVRDYLKDRSTLA